MFCTLTRCICAEDELSCVQRGSCLCGLIYLQAVVEEADVQIVLSTSWARHLGYQRARKALPEPVSRLVVGATWHSAMRKAGSDHRTLWGSANTV